MSLITWINGCRYQDYKTHAFSRSISLISEINIESFIRVQLYIANPTLTSFSGTRKDYCFPEFNPVDGEIESLLLSYIRRCYTFRHVPSARFRLIAQNHLDGPKICRASILTFWRYKQPLLSIALLHGKKTKKTQSNAPHPRTPLYAQDEGGFHDTAIKPDPLGCARKTWAKVSLKFYLIAMHSVMFRLFERSLTTGVIAMARTTSLEAVK